LKSYPRAKHKLRVTRSSKQLPEPQPSERAKKRKVTSSTSKFVPSEKKCGSSASESAVTPRLRVVKPFLQTETLEALDASDHIVALVRLPAVSGYLSIRYLKESALGQNFSHFGKTRLLPTFRPGRKVREFTFTHPENMGPSVSHALVYFGPS
jgi:hypothetical protein